MTTLSFPSFIDALVANLSARAGMVGVQITSAPMGAEEQQTDSLAFYAVDAVTDFAALGNVTQREDYMITARIRCEVPGAGTVNAKVARDRAYAILSEVAGELTGKPTGAGPTQGISAVKWSRVSDERLRQTVSDRGRVSVLDFRVAVSALI